MADGVLAAPRLAPLQLLKDAKHGQQGDVVTCTRNTARGACMSTRAPQLCVHTVRRGKLLLGGGGVVALLPRLRARGWSGATAPSTRTSSRPVGATNTASADSSATRLSISSLQPCCTDTSSNCRSRGQPVRRARVSEPQRAPWRTWDPAGTQPSTGPAAARPVIVHSAQRAAEHLAELAGHVERAQHIQRLERALEG